MTDQPAQPSLFIKNLVFHLLPYFKAFEYPSDRSLIADTLTTLAEYGTRTRAEMLHVAFFSALDTLAQAREDHTISPALRLRYRVCANALNRSAAQHEAALATRLACDLPAATIARAKPAPSAASPQPEPVNDRPDADVAEALRQARAKIDSYRNRLASTPTPQTAKRIREPALSRIFNGMTAPSSAAMAGQPAS